MMLKSPLGSSNCWKRWSYLFWKFNLRSLSFSLTSSFSDFRNEFFCGDFNDRFINSQILYFGYRQTGRRKPHIAHSLVFSKVSLVKVRVLVASWKYGTFLRWSRTFGQANELLHPPEKTIMFGDGRRNIFSISETCISQKISQYTVSQFFTKHLLISAFILWQPCVLPVLLLRDLMICPREKSLKLWKSAKIFSRVWPAFPDPPSDQIHL